MGIFNRYVNKSKDAGLSESRLWVEFLEGSSDAFEHIYESYFDKLYNYGVHLCRDKTLVEDCIQELFLDLWNNRNNINLAKSVKYYLLKSLRRRIIRGLSKRKQVYLYDELQGRSDFHIVLAWNCLEKSYFYSNTNSVQGHETENVRKNARKLTRSSLKHIREGKTDFFPKKIILMGSYHF